jgi:hypothetical protein
MLAELAFTERPSSSSRSCLHSPAVDEHSSPFLRTHSSIKVVTITGLIVLGIVLDLGGGPNRDRIGFRYWKNPGPFVQYDGISGPKGRFLGFFSVLTQAAFSFVRRLLVL